MTHEQLWQATLGELELSLSKPSFATWFGQTNIASIENGRAVVSAPSLFIKNWLERKHTKTILGALQRLTNREVKEVSFEVGTRQAQALISQTGAVPINSISTREHATISTTVNESGLNPRYALANFIVGKNSELAQAATKAVIDNPGTAYNPLFIYGGVGLGKTHLLQAIGNEILKRNPEKKVLYATCETFTNQFIEAIRGGKGKTFHDVYRKVDVLLIDDIQFISGKTETQEAFFHTFNDLHQANKQVALTSDRPPKAIPTLEDRLISRFEAGMIVDIAAPDVETRTAILEAKCQEKQYALDKKIIEYLAENIRHNVRELEGVLNKIIAFHQLKNIPPSLEFIQTVLAAHQQPLKKNVTPKQIIQTVANFYDIKIEDVLGKSREKRLAHPRQIVMFLIRTELGASYPTIGHELGGRDHTTAMYACEKIRKDIENNLRIKQEVDLIKQRLSGN